MESLENIVCENIRRNWSDHKDDVTNNYYELLWKELIQKFKIYDTDIFFRILKKFIENKLVYHKKPLLNRIYVVIESDDILILKGLTSEERNEIHLLCDNIGLHHQSKQVKKKRHLYIYKPELWLWEFSEKNPYSKPVEYYKKRQNRQTKLDNKKNNMYCCLCGSNGLENELLCSVYIRGLFCDDCIENDEELCGHKFEPI